MLIGVVWTVGKKQRYCLFIEAEDAAFFHNEAPAVIGNKQLLQTLISCKIPLVSINKVLKVLKSYTNPNEIHMLPKDVRTAIGKYPTPEIKNIDVEPPQQKESNIDACLSKSSLGTLIYFGIEKSMRNGAAKYDDTETLLLSINIDGMQLFDSNVHAFWPIVGRFHANPCFIIALYYGRGKPKDVNQFLKDFVAEYIHLQKHGIFINNKKYLIHLHAALFDCPARAFILNVPYYNAQDGCYKCVVEGITSNHRTYFLGVDAAARSITDFFGQYRNKKKDLSLMFSIENFNPVHDSPLDSMHCVDLGVTKKLLLMWTGHFKKFRFSFSSKEKIIINDRMRIMNSHCPREFGRQPRTMQDVSLFKAKEFRQFVLYIGPVIMHGLLSKDRYRHFLILHVAMRMLNDPDLTSNTDALNFAEALLLEFVTQFSHIYSEELVSMNVHSLVHLTDDVRKYGPLISYSSYPYENYLGQIGSLVRNGRLPATQIHRRIHEFTVLDILHNSTKQTESLTKISKAFKYCEDLPRPEDMPQNCRYFLKCEFNSYTFVGNSVADKYCQIKGQYVMSIAYFIQNCSDNEIKVCGYILEDLELFFNDPCNSDNVDIIMVQLRPDLGSLKCMSLSNITGKYYSMPLEKDKIVLAKLLHSKCSCVASFL